MKLQQSLASAIWLFVCLNKPTLAQEKKTYNGEHFIFQYPGGWSVRESNDAVSVVLFDIPDNIPIYQIMIGLIPGTIDLDKDKALHVINNNLSAIAAGNHAQLTYLESGPAKGNRVEVLSTLRSPVQNADVYSSVGLNDHVYVEVMYEVGKRDTALADAYAVFQTVRIKEEAPLNDSRAATASQGDAWKTYTNADFSISYPGSWRASTEARKFTAIEPGDPRRFLSIEFRPGFENKPGILNQCASTDELLKWIYDTVYAPRDSGNRQYPYTDVTHDDIKPGWLGGRDTTEAWQLPSTQLAYVEVVPRVGGAYIVTDSRPSEAMEVHEPFRRKVFSSIVFKSQPLDGKAYCNYLGR
jgi:hypothetical protein